jgi:hypothetical protein
MRLPQHACTGNLPSPFSLQDIELLPVLQINVYISIYCCIFYNNYFVLFFLCDTLILDIWIQLTIYQLIFNLQAVVVSIDPRRVYINNPNDVQYQTIKVSSPGEVFSFLPDFNIFMINEIHRSITHLQVGRSGLFRFCPDANHA